MHGRIRWRDGQDNPQGWKLIAARVVVIRQFSVNVSFNFLAFWTIEQTCVESMLQVIRRLLSWLCCCWRLLVWWVIHSEWQSNDTYVLRHEHDTKSTLANNDAWSISIPCARKSPSALCRVLSSRRWWALWKMQCTSIDIMSHEWIIKTNWLTYNWRHESAECCRATCGKHASGPWSRVRQVLNLSESKWVSEREES